MAHNDRLSHDADHQGLGNDPQQFDQRIVEHHVVNALDRIQLHEVRA